MLHHWLASKKDLTLNGIKMLANLNLNPNAGPKKKSICLGRDLANFSKDEITMIEYSF
jgi:hypothetical protein